MADLKNIDPLRIEHAPDGGFIVSDLADYGRVNRPVFASSSIGEALDFIKGRLAPAAAPEKAIDRACTRCGSLGMEAYCSLCNRPRAQ
ncbi:hypothetical protein SAMN05443254_11033 [Bradyrhizobium sp. OK095]|nr:hypothetical protein SAMN05443254_11033 [Bradyrhizobium sp. OK095]